MQATSHGHGGRLLWVDVAKGLSIALVVLHHLTTKHFELVVPEMFAALETAWVWLTLGLKPLRMPLFFVVSGLLAAPALQRPWPRVVGPKVFGVYQLYALWLLIHTAVFSYATDLPMNRTQDLRDLLADLVYASTGLWYLYALAVYFLLARLLRPFDRRHVLFLAVAVAVCSWLLPIDAVNRISVLQHFVYFIIGSRFPTAISAWAGLRSHRVAPALAVGYAVMGGLLLVADAPRGVKILALSVIAVPLGIRLAVVLAGHPLVARPVSFLGRRTLPVYVLHVPLLSLLHQLFVGLDPGRPLLLLLAYPALGTTLLIAVALAIHRAADKLALGWLFRWPLGGQRRSRLTFHTPSFAGRIRRPSPRHPQTQ